MPAAAFSTFSAPSFAQFFPEWTPARWATKLLFTQVLTALLGLMHDDVVFLFLLFLLLRMLCSLMHTFMFIFMLYKERCFLYHAERLSDYGYETARITTRHEFTISLQWMLELRFVWIMSIILCFRTYCTWAEPRSYKLLPDYSRLRKSMIPLNETEKRLLTFCYRDHYLDSYRQKLAQSVFSLYVRVRWRRFFTWPRLRQLELRKEARTLV